MTRILLVDDDPDIRDLVAYALSDEGYEVDKAADGQTALELADKHTPDVILLDMRMPKMDGWQFARLYRQRHDHKAPIIVLTAAQDAGHRAADIEAEEYIAKPFDLEALLERISAVTAESGAGQQRPPD